MKKVLLIGAFERDNFGDALMYLITEKVFTNLGYEVVPASIMLSSNVQLENRQIYPYDYLLHSELWDIIWVVGGELGGVDIAIALSISDPSGSSNRRLYQIPRDNTLLAYIPNLINYQLNKDAKLVINSAGLSSPAYSGNDTLLNQLSTIYNKAAFVSVRDKNSYDTVSSPHKSLSPDLVHALPRVFDLQRTCSYYPYISFQVGADICNTFGVENTAIELLKVAKEYSYRVLLTPSGLANCHDSLDQYNRILEILTLGGVYTKIVENRDPFVIVQSIADSSLWIGSSLHGRIIASTFNVPRVSLKSTKVSNYVSLWDSAYPCEVGLSSILDATDIAFKVNAEPVDLSTIAYDNILNIIRIL